MTPNANKGVPRGRLILYALTAFVVALPTIPVYIHLPALYGVELGLGLAATGLFLLLARLFDTVSDPVIGYLSDQYGFRGARRKPWIAIGAVVAGFGLYKILNPPSDVGGLYLLLWSIVLYTGWTMVSVPYLAWGAELVDDYDDRTRLTSWREAMTLVGIFGAGALAAITADMGWASSESIGAIAWLAIGLGAVVIPLLLWYVPDGPVERQGQSTLTGAYFSSVISNGPFLRLLGAWFLNGLANGIPAALFFIYLEFGLGAGEEIRPLFILAYFGAGIASIPIWLKLSKQFGKHRTWCWAMAAAALAFISVPVLPSGAFTAFAIVCLITGMALGADLTLPPAMQADVLDYDRWRFKEERAGIQFALWGMSTKLALALSVGLALPALEVLGFDPDAPTEAGKSAITVIYAFVPVVIKIAAITVVWRFPLTRKRHDIIRHRLKKRQFKLGNMKELTQ
ncbi:MFS transporter [uncultured Sneathiella sp.]|uniref:MFS transporter n=1 Tax=uncultured Sneathiella sp. TaxID=879315 RepID=UPI0030ECC4C9|tara:strand:- start:10189 stop:11553 length:1365 start_codon:yes stop_codon:yes gene_type:complete